jgi:FixJ family two-component response regulator
MPEASGMELAQQVRHLQGQTNVFFASGYSDNAVVCQEGLNIMTAHLQNLFSSEGSARKVREVLDPPQLPQSKS